MRSRLATLALVLSLASCGSSSARTSAARSPSKSSPRALTRCGPGYAHTIAANALVRVYTNHGQVYGCSEAAKGSYLLGSVAGSALEARVQSVVLAGELAAYGLQRRGADYARASVVVRRLTDGRQMRSAPAITGAVIPESFQSVDSVALKRDGAVAWIAGVSSVVGHKGVRQVHKWDRLGERLLDSGEQVKPRSLRLQGSSLSWKHGKSRRHAVLH